jgi:nucleoside-diphosphate-sugar epimerase
MPLHDENKRTIFLFGASGNLGRALAQANPEARGFSREQMEAGAPDLPVQDAPLDWIFAAGATDPALPPGVLERANYDLPARWIEAILSRRPRDRVMTFGTLLENFPEISVQNAYVASKCRLAQFVRELDRPGQVMHLQLHTLYGGTPRPHLFLGQLIRSLRESQPLKMTSGRQLREYHAIEDIALFVKGALARGLPSESVVLLSSGAPVRLGELAHFVFEALNRLPLLQLGALPEPKVENWSRAFPRSPEAWGFSARDPLTGVLAYVKTQI